jgi:hypothetical protein
MLLPPYIRLENAERLMLSSKYRKAVGAVGQE